MATSLQFENLSRSIAPIERVTDAPTNRIDRMERQIDRQITQFDQAAGTATAPDTQGGKTFAELLESSMDQVNVQQHQADKAIKEFVAGKNKNIHETMLAIERADSSLKMMMQVRNKVLEAYREIMRMQV